MGPNGTGKSSLLKAIMNNKEYEKDGTILYNNEDITNIPTNEIANKGIYYLSQSPIEVEGITNAELIKTALVEKGIKYNIFEFKKECESITNKLEMDKSFINRYVNVGMSGGERKKNEILHMNLLKPSLILLDEIDSGLDVDALKVIANNLIEYQENTNASILIITHQQSLIDILNPDYVHVISNKLLRKSGDISLAKEISKNGFKEYEG